MLTNTLACGLNKVSGQYYQFDPKDVVNNRNPLSIQHALFKKAMLSYLGPEYNMFVLPVPPANEIYLSEEKWKKCTFANDQFITHIYSKADLKCCDLIGINSGRRSALYKYGDKLYRLKGCGNYGQGFPTERCFSMIENTVEVRGTQHLYTALREMIMTHYIIEDIGLRVANIPIAIWKYDKLPSDKNYTDKADKIDKYCSVFETIGDKRGQTHLLQGILILLHMIIKHGLDMKEYDSIEEQLKNYIEKCMNKGYYPTKDCFLTFPTKRLKSKDDIFTNDVFPDEIIATMATLRSLGKNECFQKLFNIEKIISNIDAICIEYGIKDATKFKQCLEQLKGCLFDKIMKFTERAGYEIAYNLRRMIEHDINWGCYWDLNPQSIHCNSHPDNVTVIPKNIERIFAVLDFDLAFHKKNHINIDETSPNYAMPDDEEFYSFTSRQIHEMDNMLLNWLDLKKESLVELPLFKGKEKQLYDFLCGITKETCTYAYRKTISHPLKEISNIPDPSIYDLIDAALLLTDSIIA